MWGRISNMLRREGSDLDVLSKFYLAVIQAVLFFGAENWVLLAPMLQRM